MLIKLELNHMNEIDKKILFQLQEYADIPILKIFKSRNVIIKLIIFF